MISRQAAIKAIEERAKRIKNEDTLNGLAGAVAILFELPSVNPQENTGHWIAQDIHNCHTDFKCSECGYIHNFMHLYGEPTADYTYCPNCGAKMVEPQDISDRNLKMWHDIYAEEKRRERSE